MAAFHWIEPEYVHNQAYLSGGKRYLYPQFELPALGFFWRAEGAVNLPNGRPSVPAYWNAAHRIWDTCNQTLQHAYSYGKFSELQPHDGVGGIWTNQKPTINDIYIVEDLGGLKPRKESVVHLNSEQGRLPDYTVRTGLRQ